MAVFDKVRIDADKTSYPVFHDPRPGKLMTQLPVQEGINAGALLILLIVSFGTAVGDVTSIFK